MGAAVHQKQKVQGYVKISFYKELLTRVLLGVVNPYQKAF